MIEQVVITDALCAFNGKVVLNPALLAWEKPLLAMKQQWQGDVGLATPLSWFSDLEKHRASSLLAGMIEGLPAAAKQFWIASPYHAKLTRSSLRVMPESMMDWSELEAEQLCHSLNPLLAEEGMALHLLGSALLLTCDRIWDVKPEDFSMIAGGSLPDRLPSGKDAGPWMRLLSEIQMTMHQQPLRTMQGIDIHGLWFWHSAEQVVAKADLMHVRAVATRHSYLKSLLQAMDRAREASMIISESDDLSLLLKEGGDIPKEWLLLGEGRAVRLTSSILHRCLALVCRPVWKGA